MGTKKKKTSNKTLVGTNGSTPIYLYNKDKRYVTTGNENIEYSDSCPLIFPVQPSACPVCNGRGQVYFSYCLPGETWTGTSEGISSCHSCEGTGIVWFIYSNKGTNS